MSISTAASDARFLSPTPFSWPTSMAARSGSVIGGRALTDVLLDAEQVRVERLPTGVDLDLHAGAGVGDPAPRSRPCRQPERRDPVMIVSNSRSGVTSWPSKSIDARTGDSATATMPSPRTMPIQSPAAIGPASLLESRTACVTSPVATVSIASAICGGVGVGRRPPGRRPPAPPAPRASCASARRAPSWTSARRPARRPG